jgi:hypothetical protein
MAVYQPSFPIAKMLVVARFKQLQGSALFDDIRVTIQPNGVCQTVRLAHALQQSDLLQIDSTHHDADEQRSIILDTIHDVAMSLQQERLVLLYWHLPADNYCFEHHALLQSIFYHQRNSIVRVVSTTLPTHVCC